MLDKSSIEKSSREGIVKIFRVLEEESFLVLISATNQNGDFFFLTRII